MWFATVTSIPHRRASAGCNYRTLGPRSASGSMIPTCVVLRAGDGDGSVEGMLGEHGPPVGNAIQGPVPPRRLRGEPRLAERVTTVRAADTATGARPGRRRGDRRAPPRPG